MTERRTYHKSSYSGASNNNCVEVAEGAITAVRDTQNRGLGQLEFGAEEWCSLVDSLRRDG